MKILYFILLFSVSCQPEYCWTLSTSTKTTSSPSHVGYPISGVSNQVECGITKDEAETIAESNSGTKTETVLINNTYYTLTTTWSTSFNKKDN